MILRKGTIAAHKGEKVLIPINMRHGSVPASVLGVTIGDILVITGKQISISA